MTEQWQELKETITEMRDNDGTGTQQEVCRFLVNYMDILEKQIQEQCEDCVSKQAVVGYLCTHCPDDAECFNDCDDIKNIKALPSINSQEPKTEKVIKMRRPTPEERESIEKYVKSISKTTGVDFWNLDQEPKMGHWIYEKRKRLMNETDEGAEYITDYWCKCSKCGGDFGYIKMKDAFCKYCGAKMVPESEDKE